LLSLFRRCDSRTLNLSPFCTLSSPSPDTRLKWLPTVNSIYGAVSPAYLSGLAGPLRREYPTHRMEEDEILKHLTKVMIHRQTNQMYPSQGDPMYNAYERDLAVVNIFFGDSTVFGEYK
jgi:hypothetical protein